MRCRVFAIDVATKQALWLMTEKFDGLLGPATFLVARFVVSVSEPADCALPWKVSMRKHMDRVRLLCMQDIKSTESAVKAVAIAMQLF